MIPFKIPTFVQPVIWFIADRKFEDGLLDNVAFFPNTSAVVTDTTNESS
jgi:hypothetical protein